MSYVMRFPRLNANTVYLLENNTSSHEPKTAAVVSVRVHKRIRRGAHTCSCLTMCNFLQLPHYDIIHTC